MLTPLEWMAWALIALSVVKILVVLVRPRLWVKYVTIPFYSHTIFCVVSVIAVLGGFYYLTREMTVEQIFAAFFVMALLMSITLRPYAKDMVMMFQRSLGSRSVIRNSWFALSLWALLIAWAAYYLIRY